MTTKVILTRKIPKVAFDILKKQAGVKIISWDNEEPIERKTFLEYANKNPDCAGILCMLTDKIDEELLSKLNKNKLKVVSTMSVGHDHIDKQACKKYGIKVGYTPGVLTNSTSDLAVTLLLAAARRLKESSDAAINGEWTTWKPEWLLGKEVYGSTVGIIGLGRIGSAFAKRMHHGFDCKILYSDVSEKDFAKDFNGKFVDLDTLLAESDFVVPHCDLNSKTKEMCNLEFFKKMRKDAIFINTTRGDVVKQDDLLTALQNNIISYAGIDVTVPEPLPTNHPLLKQKNCIVLPHIASSTRKCRNDMATLAVNNLLLGIQGKNLLKEVGLD